jgi:predicted XRE-type DNA-binding protein
MKPIEFRGNSLNRLREFPKEARREAGFQLDRVQRGLEPFDWKPMSSVGAGVREIRVRDDSGAFRVLYVTKFEDPGMSKKKRFASVWDAIEDSARDAASMKLRAELAHEIIGMMQERKLTQAKAAALIGVTQPRISDLMRGRLGLFSLDALVDMADRVGLRTRMVISPKRAA